MNSMMTMLLFFQQEPASPCHDEDWYPDPQKVHTCSSKRALSKPQNMTLMSFSFYLYHPTSTWRLSLIWPQFQHCACAWPYWSHLPGDTVKFLPCSCHLPFFLALAKVQHTVCFIPRLFTYLCNSAVISTSTQAVGEQCIISSFT